MEGVNYGLGILQTVECRLPECEFQRAIYRALYLALGAVSVAFELHQVAVDGLLVNRLFQVIGL